MGLTDRNSVRHIPWRPFQLDQWPYRVCAGVPIAKRGFEQTIGLHNSGKPNKCSEKRKSMEKIGKCLTFSKFRLFRLLSAGSRPPLPLYHTSLQKSIGKLHKKNRLTVVSRFFTFTYFYGYHQHSYYKPTRHWKLIANDDNSNGKGLPFVSVVPAVPFPVDAGMLVKPYLQLRGVQD